MTGSSNGIIHRVRHLFRQADPAPDDELLTRFIDDRDGEAFALLVRRHGPMVHGVCRRVLRNGADADDAFQATFLVLARRAGALRPRSLLGNWLYGVAYRTALEAKRAAAVRRARERRAAEMKTSAPAADTSPPDLREVLDRELAALPDVYRAAVVLCDLEGLSRKDAAERLGWSEGTLSGRLFRARSMLAARISRLGLAVPAAGIGVVASSASAGIPAALAESTVRIGILVAAGEAVSIAAAPVAALTEGVMKAMLLTKLKGMATALVVGCALLATTVAGWQANATGAADAVADGQATRKTARDPDKDRIAQLERERDELLKLVRELKERLEKLEANATLGEKMKRREVEDERALIEDALRRRKIEDERARLTADDFAKLERLGTDRARLEIERAKLEAERARAGRGAPPKTAEDRTPAEQLDRFRKLELELAKDPKARERARDAASDLAEKLKALELDAAKVAKLKALQGGDPATKTKPPAGDRVAALEDRVKAMEADLRKLIVELERMRKK